VFQKRHVHPPLRGGNGGKDRKYTSPSYGEGQKCFQQKAGNKSPAQRWASDERNPGKGGKIRKFITPTRSARKNLSYQNKKKKAEGKSVKSFPTHKNSMTAAWENRGGEKYFKSEKPNALDFRTTTGTCGDQGRKRRRRGASSSGKLPGLTSQTMVDPAGLRAQESKERSQEELAEKYLGLPNAEVGALKRSLPMRIGKTRRRKKKTPKPKPANPQEERFQTQQ